MKNRESKLARLCGLLGAASLLLGCNSETCTPYSCSTVNPANPATLNICESGEEYVRLDDAQGNEVYECYCDKAHMEGVAARICTEGVVCRKAGSACSGSGDCCAGLHCTYNVCG